MKSFFAPIVVAIAMLIVLAPASVAQDFLQYSNNSQYVPQNEEDWSTAQQILKLRQAGAARDQIAQQCFGTTEQIQLPYWAWFLLWDLKEIPVNDWDKGEAFAAAIFTPANPLQVNTGQGSLLASHLPRTLWRLRVDALGVAHFKGTLPWLSWQQSQAMLGMYELYRLVPDVIHVKLQSGHITKDPEQWSNQTNDVFVALEHMLLTRLTPAQARYVENLENRRVTRAEHEYIDTDATYLRWPEPRRHHVEDGIMAFFFEQVIAPLARSDDGQIVLPPFEEALVYCERSFGPYQSRIWDFAFHTEISGRIVLEPIPHDDPRLAGVALDPNQTYYDVGEIERSGSPFAQNRVIPNPSNTGQNDTFEVLAAQRRVVDEPSQAQAGTTAAQAQSLQDKHKSRALDINWDEIPIETLLLGIGGALLLLILIKRIFK
ncbi:MAG: hypothetical protein H6619_01395 [Deltaproteobacteria bacterium]|nr:hypothetical protein [Deltaproteobacteria bacterium]